MIRLPRLRFAILLLLLGLVGCSTTVFQSLPAGAATDCDPAWPGLWKSVATTDDEVKPQGAMEISADCRSVSDKDERKPIRLTLVDTGDGQYLVLHNDSGEPDCIGGDKSRCGHALLRYQREDDIIRVYDADHALIAAAIKAGELEGFSERAGDAGPDASEPIRHYNYVAGDGKRIAELLRRHPEYFAAEPLLTLRRVAAEAANDSTDAAPDAAAAQPTPES